MKRKTSPPVLSPTQEQALNTILNLRKLTRETGTISTRAQNSVLRTLNDLDLAAVANALATEDDNKSNPKTPLAGGPVHDER
jgi:hypothetical protein